MSIAQMTRDARTARLWYDAHHRTPMKNPGSISCPGCGKAIYSDFEICGKCVSRVPEPLRERIRDAKPGSEQRLIAIQEAADHLTAGGSRTKARTK